MREPLSLFWDDRGQQSLENYYRQFSREELAGVKAVGYGHVGPLHCGHQSLCAEGG